MASSPSPPHKNADFTWTYLDRASSFFCNTLKYIEFIPLWVSAFYLDLPGHWRVLPGQTAYFALLEAILTAIQREYSNNRSPSPRKKSRSHQPCPCCGKRMSTTRYKKWAASIRHRKEALQKGEVIPWPYWWPADTASPNQSQSTESGKNRVQSPTKGEKNSSKCPPDPPNAA